MNADRRKQIADVEAKLGQLKERAESLKEQIESIKDDEESAKEALPDSIQEGERGQQMDTNAENLNSAADEIDNITSAIEDAERYLAAAREGE